MLPNRFVIVWDNFESASGNEPAGIDPLLSPDDLQLLRRFLSVLRGGKTKVIITSRSEESWLSQDLRCKLPLGGLIGEERWEFCTAILRNLGLRVDRDDPDMIELMELLDGHPLLMRAVLPRLEDARRTRTIIDELRGNLGRFDPGEDQTQEKFNATLRFVEDGLPVELRPLLVPLALHERFADADSIEAMSKQIEQIQTSRAQIDRLMAALATAGLVRDRGQGVIYELHPALTGFLRSKILETVDEKVRQLWTRAFVDVMGRLADRCAPRPLHEQRGVFQVHSANFHTARSFAEQVDMEDHFAALTQSLATYAQNTWNLDGAERLFRQLAEHRNQREDKVGEAGAYHQLGMIAQECRDFETAEKWCLKSLQIVEKLGNEALAAKPYHQLGMIAQERRAFERADQWYRKALEIDDKFDNEAGTAITYHQLGRIAEELRAFERAEQWYLKSLQINKNHGNEAGAASTYHHLGMIAQERRDFEVAEKWYLESLHIKEKFGNEAGAASTYHQLGNIACESRDFKLASKWYLKSLQIKEKLGDEAGAASTYHQLGRIAEERRDFEGAEQWYLKSLEISEKLGNEAGAALTYHQLGVIAEERRDFERAEQWYLKSLQISEKLGNEVGAASTYGQLGNVAGRQGRFVESARWLTKSLLAFERCRHPAGIERNTHNFVLSLYKASEAERAEMVKMWREAGLGELPEEKGDSPDDR